MVLKVTRQPGIHVASAAPLSRALWGLVALVASVGYLASTLHQGWVPHDTGQLGQTAERILDGEMQHRDFDEPYTGGLGHLHALTFRLLGVRAESMRWTALVFASLFAAAVYLISVRVAPPWVAAGVTLLSAGLTLPIYSAGMPSWYNLFFMVLGVLALLQHHDSGQRKWLFWAGCCAGCSLAFKITGLYFVATALLYIAYRSALVDARSRERGRAYSAMVAIACAVFILLGLAFMRGSNPVVNLVHFTVPMAAIAACLGWQQWRSGGGRFVDRLTEVGRDLVPLGLGVGAVIGVFVFPYIVTGSLDDLYRGLFVLPTMRLSHAELAPPDLKWMALSLPVTVLLVAGMFRPAKSLTRPFVIVTFCVVCGALLLASDSPRGYFYLFQALRNQIPLLVLVAVVFVLPKMPASERAAVFLVVVAVALGSLLQYPYAYGTYFFYAAPLLAIAMLYVIASQPFAPKPLFATLLLFSLAFVVLRLPQPDPRLMNGFYDPDFPTSTMTLSRCQFRVYREDARVYEELVHRIQSLVPPGGTIYAGPDCPEVYFLSETRNPTRTFYEFFDGPSDQRTHELVGLLDRRQIDVVVVNHDPDFSAALSDSTMDALLARFPYRQAIRGVEVPGDEPKTLFTVLWRVRSYHATYADYSALYR